MVILGSSTKMFLVTVPEQAPAETVSVMVFTPGVEYVTAGGFTILLVAGVALAPTFQVQLPELDVLVNVTGVFKQTVSATVKLAVGLPMLTGTLKDEEHLFESVAVKVIV